MNSNLDRDINARQVASSNRECCYSFVVDWLEDNLTAAVCQVFLHDALGSGYTLVTYRMSVLLLLLLILVALIC